MVGTIVVYSLVVVITHALLLVGVVAARLVGEEPTTDMAGVHDFRTVDRETWAGGQPNAEAYRELAARGVRLAADLPTGTRDDPRKDDPVLLGHLGVGYLALPIPDGHVPAAPAAGRSAGGAVGAGHTTVNEVWEAYARCLYLHRLRSIDVLSACVATAPASTAWESEGAAVAEALDARSGTYVGLVAAGGVSSARGTTLLVRPREALAQLAAARPAGVDEDDGDGSAPAEPVRLRRFYGVVSVDPDRLGRDAGRIAQHLNALVGTEMEVTIEVRAAKDDGFADDIVRIVNENASTLRFRAHGFEND